MLYITETLDLSLLQFGPAAGNIKEISLRTAASLIQPNSSFWMLSEHSRIKELLRQSENWTFFEKVQDLQIPDVFGINEDDTILMVARTPDCHLLVGQTGFRYFQVSLKVSGKMRQLNFESGEMEPVPTS